MEERNGVQITSVGRERERERYTSEISNNNVVLWSGGSMKRTCCPYECIYISAILFGFRENTLPRHDRFETSRTQIILALCLSCRNRVEIWSCAGSQKKVHLALIYMCYTFAPERTDCFTEMSDYFCNTIYVDSTNLQSLSESKWLPIYHARLHI